MKKIFTLCVVLCLSYLSMGATNLKHEFRATWLTTAWGNDWPKTKVTNDATRNQQQDELIAIFDRLQAGNMNAVCLQVRGRSDAFYQSSYEPWAAELAGARGTNPGYDPLAFAIEEAHKRGLELHAWVNPFRVTSAGTLDANDLVKQNAGQWIIQYNNGSFTGEIIDPGYPEAREYVLNVLMEIISNYDIDGIVMDDYFYPYGGTTTEDAASKALHKPANVVDVNQDGYTDDDWRRSNVDVFLKEFYNRIQTTKPWVRLGMGTFGIWTTQSKVAQAYGISLPSGISGLDDYDEQACNPVEWVKNGYVDYINPQLYWPTTSTGQNYNKLCQWWAKDVCEHFSNQLTNGKKVHFFSSQSISANPTLSEIQSEIDVNRNNLSSGSTGSVFFDTDAYLTMDGDLTSSRFSVHALPPAMDWKSNTALAAPTNLTVSGSTLSWQHATAERFTVYVYPKGTTWSTAKNDPAYLQGVIYGNSMDISGIDTNMNDIAVCAYDRFGVEHEVAIYSDESGTVTPPASGTITYVLNGGMMNEFGWTSKDDMFQACMADCGVTTLPSLDEIKATGNDAALTTICAKLSDVSGMLNSDKWEWLEQYIMEVQNAQAGTSIGAGSVPVLTAGVTSAGWRYALAAFFIEGQRTTWPYSADFSQAGKDEAYIPAWKHVYTNPTSVTTEFTLYDPCREGYTFLGWYANADFSGEKVITINAETTGTFYAKWINSDWIITYTSTDGNIVTPYKTDVFGANIVSNTYENGVGTITFDGSITTIGRNAFSGCSSLTSVTIPNSVESIGDNAFCRCESLSSIVIPSSVTNVGENAFSLCKSLTYVKWNVKHHPDFGWYDWPFDYKNSPIKNFCFGDEVEYIPAYLCYGMDSLTQISIPYGVIGIGKSAFDQCSYLLSVTIPNTVKTIGNSAFFYCSSLLSITIPQSITSIGNGAFSYCKFSKENFINNSTAEGYPWGADIFNTNEDDGYFIKDSVLLGVRHMEESVVIPPYVVSIAANALYGCSLVSHITIPNSVRSIGNRAFMECSSLVSITIPKSVTSIGDGCFAYCESMTSIIVEDGNQVYDSRNNCNAIIETATNKLITGCKSTTIPNRVTSIGNEAFEGCTYLTSITIPQSVTSIGDIAFSGATSLSSITLPNSIKSIGYGAFTFCNSLESITIPSSVISIENGAFSHCPSITSIIVEEDNVNYDSRNNCNAIIETATGTLIAGSNTTVIPNTVKNIGKSAFSDRSISSISIPDSITYIGDECFYGCTHLDTIYIGPIIPPTLGNTLFSDNMSPVFVTPCGTLAAYEASDWANYMGEFVEEGCIDPTWQITYTSSNDSIVTPSATDVFGANIVNNIYENGVGTITFDGPVTSIGDYAFYECSALTSITIPSSVKSIENYAFDRCSGLTKTNYTGDVASWCDIKFGNYYANPICYSHNFYINDIEIRDLVIPNTVDSIHNYAFENCSNLTSVTIDNDVISIGDRVFIGCSGLTSATIPNSVTSIGDYAFAYCSSLTSVIIGSSVTSIGDYAFAYCSSLTSVIIGSNVTSIGVCAFQFCSAVSSIIIPSNVTSIGNWAFGDCSSLTSITIPKTVSNIGINPFAGCSGLSSIVVENGNAIYDSRGNCNAIVETATNTLISGCQNTIIPNDVTSIGSYAFGKCSLIFITIPNSVISIGEYAFEYCRSLTSITIPNTVISIGRSAFMYCSSLDTIYVEATTPTTLGQNVFEGTPSLLCVIPCGTLAEYEMSRWKNYVEAFVFDDTCEDKWCGDNLYWKYRNGVLTLIGTGDMYDYASDIDVPWYDVHDKITSINIPNGISKIGNNAFASCISLDEIYVEAAMPSALGNNALASSPICFIPCGAIATYQSSNWASQVGEFVEVCPAVVKAKVPASWEDDDITVWVWTDGAGTEYPTTKEGDWYVYTHSDAEEFNIIFKSGTGWKGNTYQTVDINGITENTCLEIQPTTGKATYTIVDCNNTGIIYKGNGGITNGYGWMSKDDMYHELLVDINAIMPTTKVDVDTVTLAYSKTLSVEEGIPAWWTNLDPLLDDIHFMTKWGWLITYMDGICVEQDAALQTIFRGSLFLRYHLAAFFIEDICPYGSVDYSIAGKDEAYIPAWKHGYANPTAPTDEFVLNMPYRECYTFDGWYADANFAGEQVITVDSSFNGTLYAKWVESDCPIANPVSWELEGGISPVELPTHITSAYVLPTPIRDGYVFMEWYHGNTLGIEIPMTILPIGYTGTLYAQWKKEPTDALNPFAYALSSELSQDNSQLLINYSLNARATNVQIVIMDGETAVKTIACDGLSKGSHSIAIPTAGLPEHKQLTWKVEVKGAEVTEPTEYAVNYSFYHPSAVDIDNNPENPTFGMILTNEGMHEVKDIEGYLSTGYGAGIYAFNPAFEPMPNGSNPGYNGGIEFTNGRADDTTRIAFAPRRIRISEDGRIFVTSQNTDGNYLWEVNPENMNEWNSIFKGTLNEQCALVDAGGNFIAAPNNGFDVRGAGEDLQLMMYADRVSGSNNSPSKGSYRCDEYNLGTATTWAIAPTKNWVGDKYAYKLRGTQVEYDNEGGIWLAYNSSIANETYPGLVHINKDGVEDVKLLWSNIDNAGIRFNHDFTKMILAGNNGISRKATLYNVSKDINGVPVLTEEFVIDATYILGRSLNDFAFDYAGNLYACGHSTDNGEKIVAWAMPRSADEVVTTPAASKYNFTYSDDAITYELNGGVQSEWETPQAMYNELNALWNTFSGTSKTWGDLSTLKADVAKGIPTLAYGMALDFITDENFKAKFEWLVTYMDAKCTEQGQTLPSSSAYFLRYNLQAFFIDGMRTSWPISADYTICGVSTVEAYQPYWKSGFANPTNPTEEFVLNAPYKEGYTFAGWYTTPDFSGEKVTTINAETEGTLYAKWVDYIPTIKEVRALADDTETKVAGVINHIDGRKIYIQDATGGILVYTSEEPTCKVGDKIVAEGVRFTYAGAPEVNYAVIESAETATLYDATTFETLTPLISDSIDHKYFATRVTVPGLKIVSYNASSHPTVADNLGNQVRCYNMPLDPVAFPIGKKVTISAVAGWCNVFQFVGGASAIDLSAYPKKDTYDYPVRDERYTLTNDWIYSNTEGNFAANKPGSNDYVRGMAAKDGIMYFINRENGSLTRVDGATGEMLEPLKITGEHLFERIGENGEWESACILPFNDIKFDQAGNCLIGACVSATASTQPFMIYLVDLTTGECTELINDDLRDNPGLGEVTFRFDAFGAAGDVTKNGVVMAADANDGWNVYRWLITDGVAGEGEQITMLLDPEYDQSLFINAYGWGTAPQIFPQDEIGSLFYVDGWNMLPMLFDEGGMLVDDFINCPTQAEVTNKDGDVLKMNTFHNGLVEFQVGDEYFLLMAAGNTAAAVPSCFALFKFADEGRTFDGLEPLWYFPANGMGTSTNGCRTAPVSVEVEGNKAHLYLYTNNNGYARYTLNVGDNIADPIDPTWQITYTSSNDSIVTPYATDVFGANIVSNTYENGVGTITFDGPVTSIGDNAFHPSRSLTSITIPNSVTSIGNYAFYNCSSLTSITIPNSVTSIGNNAFGRCSSLTSITIPNSVTSIGNNAFANCSSLTSITIPNSVTNIGVSVFNSCSSLTSIVVEGGNTTYDSHNNCNAIIETATNTLIAGCQNTIIPNSVTSIGDRAFFGCSSLTSITIPNSVTSIRERAFQGCSSLTSITIPNSVISIGDNPFGYTDSLTNITVETGNIYYDSRENCNAIILTSTNTLISGCQNTIIPSGVTSIGYIAFLGCSSLLSITIPNSVTSIGGAAFSSCSGLTSITIPSNVESVGDFAFGWDTLDSLHIEAATPPTLGSHKSNSSLLCYIPCGTLAAYEASDWAQYVSEFIEEGCPKITYELNGGVTNDYGWMSKNDMFQACMEDCGVTDLATLDEVKASADPFYAICSKLTDVFGMLNSDKWDWLEAYIMEVQNADLTTPATQLTEGVSSAGWRYALAAFFVEGQRTAWPKSADFSQAGKDEAYIPAWRHAFDNPTNPAEEFVLNAPYKEGYTFVGWYTNADFSGEKVTTVNSETTGTLYAKWIDDTWVIKYTSTDGNTITPTKTDVFGANIVSNTYENGVGTITFDGPVTSIGNNAFYDCRGLTSITIPNSVTSIGSSAFEYCSSLTSVTIPNSVTTIGNYAFGYCSGLTSIVVDVENTTYDSRENCNAIIETATNTLITGCQNTIIPNSVTSIGERAFWYCSGLTSITIPNSVTSIGERAFWGCSGLTFITIPNSVTTIGRHAFNNCDGLTSIVVDGGNTTYDSRENCNAIIETATNTLITGCQNTIIPNSVTSIGERAFYSCSGLTSVTIPNSVTSIGYYAFSSCSSLTSITIGNSVTSIGDRAFNECSGLTSITIPNSVTTIGNYAFGFCSGLTSVTIGNSVTTIGNYAFGFCSGLTSVTIGNSVTSIGDRAFNECSGLTSITIPNSVTSIGYRAFNGCSSLDTIHIEAITPPTLGTEAVTSSPTCYIPCGTIAAYEASDWASQVGSFEEDCVEGQQIFYTSTDGNIVTPYKTNVFGANIVSNTYENGVGTITFDGIVKNIGDYAFHDCDSLISIIIPNSVKNIGYGAFSGCVSLESITIGNGVTTIGEDVFGGCGMLTSIEVDANNVTFDSREDCNAIIKTANNILVAGCKTTVIPNGIKGIGNNAFAGNWDLTSIEIPYGVETIGSSAFGGCTVLRSVTLPNSLVTIGDDAFSTCPALTSITIPSSVKTIGADAFWCDYALDTIYVEAKTPPTLGYNVFYYVSVSHCVIPCGTLAAYEASDWASQVSEFIEEGCPTVQMCGDDLYWEYADGVLTITGTGDMYDYAKDTDVPWYDVRGKIKTVILPDAMTKIGQNAFYRCTNLTTINMPASLIAIGEKAFAQDSKLIGALTLPATLAEIGERAFFNCTGVDRYTIQAMTPPVLGDDVFKYANENTGFYVSCEALDAYKAAVGWSSLNLRDACLNIYHYGTPSGANGVHTTEDTLVANIYYRRHFTPNRWETLYLPFEVDRVTVLEDGFEYELTAWSIFSGGHYYLAKPYGIENKEVVFGFTQVVDAHTPYIIQFKDEYYRDKIITFYSEESWNKLSTSFEALPISFEMQMAGNTTLQDQILEEPVYMLRASSNFILQNTTTVLHPFECYVMPYATPSGTPARMNVRFRGDVPTAVESVKGNESRLAYTINGNTLTVYPQGQAFSIYSLNGALIYSCEAGKEAVDCELNSGCYLLHAGTEAHKIML